jgi:hypothetical protein
MYDNAGIQDTYLLLTSLLIRLKKNLRKSNTKRYPVVLVPILYNDKCEVFPIKLESSDLWLSFIYKIE